MAIFKYQLSFEVFSEDISKTYEKIDSINKFEEEEFAHKLKLSCSNVMLQCLDPQRRCTYFRTMLKFDSKTAGKIMDITNETLGSVAEIVYHFITE